MGEIYGLESLESIKCNRAVAIGVFDGVHWGHRAIFEKLVEVASARGLVSAALTFDKHPAELLAADRAPLYLSTLEQRIELIQSLGVEQVLIAEFSHALASMDKDQFIQKILVETMRAKHVVVGTNFRFGNNRDGDIRYLQSALIGLGIGLSIIPAVIISDGPVSSTRIRHLVSHGRLEDAAMLLGRLFVLRGTVVTGEQIGRTLGFPTANIQPASRQLVPADGVYVVRSTIESTTYGGVCSIGRRPTFAGKYATVEVHYIGFDADVYGKTLDVEFCKRLRDEKKFETPEKLMEQIRIDIEQASEACELFTDRA